MPGEASLYVLVWLSRPRMGVRETSVPAIAQPAAFYERAAEEERGYAVGR